MYLDRKIDNFLKNWKKDKDKKPLIIKGARQVGKTEAIRRFANKNYKNIIEINFYEEPIYKSIIKKSFKPSDIINNITLIDPSKKFIPNETLIFFDEIQECPDITTSLKFFKLDGKYDVICSGSLLGIHYKKITSVSVGYKTDYEMHSMDFEEYLWARGYNKDISEKILNNMLNATCFSEVDMQVLMDHFIDFCILGGMPKVISSHIETENFSEPYEIQLQILQDYEEDARKYNEGLDQAKIINVLRNIPSQLAKENKKFQYSKIRKGAKSKDYFGCIEWLKDTGIINICYCLNFPELPLKGNFDESKFKLYYSDTGLLISSLDEESMQNIRVNKALGVYKGAIYENFVADAFNKEGLSLYYYKREDSTLEEDFFVRDKETLIPVEVKATNEKSKSLRTLIDSKKYTDIKYGIKLTSGNIGSSENIFTFPYFCSFLIKEYLSQKN